MLLILPLLSWGHVTAATDELSDVQLEYLDPEELGLQPADVPSCGRWPHIRRHRWPFSGGLVGPQRHSGQ